MEWYSEICVKSLMNLDIQNIIFMRINGIQLGYCFNTFLKNLKNSFGDLDIYIGKSLAKRLHINCIQELISPSFWVVREP